MYRYGRHMCVTSMDMSLCAPYRVWAPCPLQCAASLSHLPHNQQAPSRTPTAFSRLLTRSLSHFSASGTISANTAFLHEHEGSVWFSMASNGFGIAKQRKLTGNQRKKLRDCQAAAIGISPDELLRQRRDSMRGWQKEQMSLSSTRCPNCGITGHSFKWCPFSTDFDLQKVTCKRFRGPYGSCDGPAIELSPEEKRKFRRFFGLLNMSLGLKSSETLPSAQSKVSE